MKRTIIAISRQYGSGGRTIGRKVAERLSIPFVDGNTAIPDFHEREGVLKEPVISFMEGAAENYAISDAMIKRFKAEIKEAASSSCVIVGLAATYILRNDPDLITIFIKAPIDSRVERAVNIYGIGKRKAEKYVNRMDTARSSFFEYVSEMKWGMARNYNLTIDSSVTGIDGAVETIISFLERAGRL